jgi:16S rRNA (adenine(1408)-N(1))-methyltransferase
VIGIDATAAAMAEASRRAARPAASGGLPNALFVVAAAERPPTELLGIADELTISFPWGSLLRGALALNETASLGIASLLKPGARLTVVVSIIARDGLALAPLDEPGAAEELARRWARHGLRLETLRPATMDDLVATGSSWARRLRAGRERPAWRVALRREGALGADDYPLMSTTQKRLPSGSARMR